MNYKKFFKKKESNNDVVKVESYLYEECLKYLKEARSDIFYLGLTKGLKDFLESKDILFIYNDFIKQMPKYFKDEMKTIWYDEN